jgi:transposase-like protein
MYSIDKRGRRWHSKEFKQEAVEACLAPGVSVAWVALERQLNANLLRRWIRASAAKRQAASVVNAVTMPATPGPVFIPLRVGRPTKAPTAEPPIRIEMNKGDARIVVEWPMSNPAACVVWLKELLG